MGAVVFTCVVAVLVGVAETLDFGGVLPGLVAAGDLTGAAFCEGFATAATGAFTGAAFDALALGVRALAAAGSAFDSFKTGVAFHSDGRTKPSPAANCKTSVTSVSEAGVFNELLQGKTFSSNFERAERNSVSPIIYFHKKNCGLPSHIAKKWSNLELSHTVLYFQTVAVHQVSTLLRHAGCAIKLVSLLGQRHNFMSRPYCAIDSESGGQEK